MKHPTALVCYNRPQHLGQVLSALRQHEPEPLYVFCDGPKDEADTKRVLAVRELIKAIDWTEPWVRTRSYNVGLAASVTAAVDRVLSHHETVILLEDDCVPGPYFYEYMNHCLDKYRDEERVMCVGGYTLPIPSSFLDGYPYDAYFYPRIESWGWATWRRAWNRYERDVTEMEAKCRQMGIDIRQGGADVSGMVKSKIEGRLDAWTPGWLLSVYLHGGCCVYPTVSHIANIGMDGSGVHCGTTDRWKTPLADRESDCFPDVIEFHHEINKVYRGKFG